MLKYFQPLLNTHCNWNENLTNSSQDVSNIAVSLLLLMYISCAGSSFLIPIPGIDDFPQIVNNRYFLGQVTEILQEAFNDTHRWQTFTVPIFADDVPEGVEELTLTLSRPTDFPLSEQSLNITPAVATVRILDFSCKFAKQFHTI